MGINLQYISEGTAALFSPETSILIQKRHPYAGNLNSETSGDSKNTFLHCGDVLEHTYKSWQYRRLHELEGTEAQQSRFSILTPIQSRDLLR